MLIFALVQLKDLVFLWDSEALIQHFSQPEKLMSGKCQEELLEDQLIHKKTWPIEWPCRQDNNISEDRKLRLIFVLLKLY